MHLKNLRGAAKITHLAKCWLYKQEVNLDSQRPCENPGAVVACLEFSRGGVERDGRVPGTCWPASLAELVSTRVSERPCLNRVD